MKIDRWKFATITFAIIIAVCIGIFVLNQFGVISTSTWFAREMKVNGEIFIVSQGRENFKFGLVEVCAIPEEKMLDWIEGKENKAKVESVKSKKAYDYALSEKNRAERDYNDSKAYTERLYQAAMADILNGSKFQAYRRASDVAGVKASEVDNKSANLTKAIVAYYFWFSPEFYFDGLKQCEVTAKTNSDGKFSLTLPRKKYALAARSERKVLDGTENYFWLIWVNPEALSETPIMLSNDNLMSTNPAEKVVEIKNLENK